MTSPTEHASTNDMQTRVAQLERKVERAPDSRDFDYLKSRICDTELKLVEAIRTIDKQREELEILTDAFRALTGRNPRDLNAFNAHPVMLTFEGTFALNN